MKQERQHRRDSDGDAVAESVQQRETAERDWSEIDAILDEIDEVLAEQDREQFKEKLRGWAARQPRLNSRWRDDPCAETRALRDELYRQGYRVVAHPLAGEDYVEVPCGCC